MTRKDYGGAKSTLCTGCGHDSVTNHIINAYFQSGILPHNVAKLSGIGCSSKTPTYFMNTAHGFNSIHGRMAPLATGVKCANHNLHLIGVSGDGDTASIGLTGFAHLLRRNSPMVYLVENNGVYGLTKGQFSATADRDSTSKGGDKNPFAAIDLCSLAIEMGCSFVARSFSGDAKQMLPLLSAAIRHPGTAFIDIVSPCVTFANHDDFSKSYNYVKEHKISLQELGYIAPQKEIEADYDEGSNLEIEMHDGSHLMLRKLEPDFDINDASMANKRLREAREKGEVLTGLFHYRKNQVNLMDDLQLKDKALWEMNEKDCRPSPEGFKKIFSEFA